MEGEPIFVTVGIEADVDQKGDFFSALRYLIQIRSGDQIWEAVPEFGCLVGPGRVELWRKKSIRFNVNQRRFKKGQREQRPLFDLPPGHYTGYVDNGKVSSPFEFKVYAYPDSLQLTWARFQYAVKLHRGVSRYEPLSDLDSTRALAAHFLTLPSGYPFRGKGMRACIDAFCLLKDHTNAEDLQMQNRLLLALSQDESVSSTDVLYSIAHMILSVDDDKTRQSIHDDLEENVENFAFHTVPGRVAEKADELVRLRKETGQRPLLEEKIF